jgi:hypothetical protein
VGATKSQPRGQRAPASHISRRLPDTVDPQFLQFAMDPRRAPAPVRLRHRANQGPDVGGHCRSADSASTLPCSPEPEACRCQAMAVSGFTRTSAVRHPAQTRASRTPESSVRSREPGSSCRAAAGRQARLGKGPRNRRVGAEATEEAPSRSGVPLSIRRPPGRSADWPPITGVKEKFRMLRDQT